MIDQLRTMAIFQKVAELGSFRAAAKSLKLSPSVISHHITQLEAQIGTPLLYRSTRRMSLTDAGTELLAAAQRMTNAATEGLAAINRRVAQPIGKLTITLNTGSASYPFSLMYSGFAKAYPKIQLDMHISDDAVSLEGSQYDLAIRGRVDGLEDSAYRATMLGKVPFGIYASPDYVASRPPVKSFADLSDWNRIQCPDVPWSTVAKMVGQNAPVDEPPVSMRCNSFQMAHQFMLDGLGFMTEAVGLMSRDVQAGRLVRVLPELKMQSLPVYAVYPANAPAESPARLLIDYLRSLDWFVENGWIIRA